MSVEQSLARVTHDAVRRPARRRHAALAWITQTIGRPALRTPWAAAFGAITLGCLFVLIVTGVILSAFYDPSGETVVYDGSYLPLQGTEMSKAMESTLAISFEVRAGLLVRQAHHWAALIMAAALMVQMLIIFFTGAFHRRRPWGWLLLFGVFVLTLGDGWSGYALPDDMLSGTGLRIVEGVMLGIPFIGTWASGLLFGEAYPGDALTLLYPLHVVIIPLALTAVILLRVRLTLVGRKSSQRSSERGKVSQRVVAAQQAATVRLTGLFFITIGVLVLMGAIMTVSPIWLYGPSSPGQASAGSQPDWYTAFLDGALRLVPPDWEVSWLGRTWTLAVIVPLVVISIFMGLIAAYPLIEGWVTKNRDSSLMPERPRHHPIRTGLGVAGIMFYGALWAAGSTDVVSTEFHISFERVVWFLRVFIVVGPPIAFVITRHLCIGLQQLDRDLVLDGTETGQLIRLPSGGYTESHRPLDPEVRARLGLSRAPTQQRADGKALAAQRSDT